jgi:hypothetical protein
MAFKAIETQEDFDIAIGERLKREREQAEKKYAGFEEAKEKAAKYDKLAAQDFEGQIKKLTEDLAAEREKNADHDKTVDELNTRAEKAEADLLKTKVAHAAGLPYELAARLNGATEEELQADAKSLASYVRPNSAPPLRTTETKDTGAKASTAAAYQALLSALDAPES